MGAGGCGAAATTPPPVVQQVPTPHTGCGTPVQQLPPDLTAPPAPPTSTVPAPPSQTSPNAAQVAQMVSRMGTAEGFDAKNTIFHEYFDAIPEADVAKRQEFFFGFMGNIAKPDADRVIQFLQGLEAQQQGSTAQTAPAAPAAPVTPPRTSTAPNGLLVIGDSLTVGTKQYLTNTMAGQPVSVDATGGISLAEGMRRYNATPVKPRVVEMALFTNNSPGQIDQLRAALEKTVADARERGGRVIWATIVRPGGYDAVNALMRDFAAKNPDVMGLVDWEKMVRENPSYLAGDKIHGTPAGYKARAQAFADAARA